MLFMDLHSTKTSDTVRIGTIEEFAEEFIKEVGSVTLTFSNSQHKKKATEALVRIFQRKWDERTR